MIKIINNIKNISKCTECNKIVYSNITFGGDRVCLKCFSQLKQEFLNIELRQLYNNVCKLKNEVDNIHLVKE